MSDFDETRDVTIIGAGPVGLATAFWTGMRQASARIIDSLPEIGGQCTTLYPEKWIFDVPGHPKILAKDLVESLRRQALEQFDVPVHLETTIETIDWEDDIVVLRTTDPAHPELRSRWTRSRNEPGSSVSKATTNSWSSRPKEYDVLRSISGYSRPSRMCSCMIRWRSCGSSVYHARVLTNG